MSAAPVIRFSVWWPSLQPSPPKLGHGAMEPRSGGEIYVFWSSDTAEQFYVGPGTASSLPCTQHLVNVISSPVNTMPRYSFPTTNLSISFLWTHVFRFIYLGFLTKNLKKKTWCKASYLLSHLKPKRLLHVGDALGDKVTTWPVEAGDQVGGVV